MGKKTGTSFSSDKQPSSRRGKSKRTKYLEALASEMGLDSLEESEIGYYKFCIRVGMGLHQYFDESKEGRDVVFGKPDAQLLKDGMARLYPIAKATYPTYEFDFPESGTVLEKADAIINAIGSGAIPIDAGRSFIDVLESRSAIMEREELAERVTKLEDMLNTGNA